MSSADLHVSPTTRSMAKARANSHHGLKQDRRRRTYKDTKQGLQEPKPNFYKATAVLVPEIPPRDPIPVIAATRGFQLLALPQEILDMIYRFMIHAGNVNILQTCSAVHRAASQYVHTEGGIHIRLRQCHVHKHCHNLIESRAISSQLAATAQHIEIKTDIGAYHCSKKPDILLLSHLFRIPVPRQTCNIILETNATPSRPVWPHIFQSLEPALIFETVTVRSVMGSGFRDYEFMIKYKWNPLLAKNKLVYRIARQWLEPSLGPSVWRPNNGQEGRYLEFHPRLHLAKINSQRKKVDSS